MKAEGYSIWLVPEGKTYDKFSDIITKLSKQFDTPIFEPHITLIGGILIPEDEVLKKTKKLATLISPYLIKLDEVDCRDHYFQSLFVKAEKTNKTLKANEQSQSLFNIKNQNYMPHMSLMYSELAKNTKDKIVKNIGNNFTDEFMVTKLHLIKAEGEVKDWEKIGVFGLH